MLPYIHLASTTSRNELPLPLIILNLLGEIYLTKYGVPIRGLTLDDYNNLTSDIYPYSISAHSLLFTFWKSSSGALSIVTNTDFELRETSFRNTAADITLLFLLISNV